MLYAIYYILYATCFTLNAICYMRHGTRYMLQAICYMIYALILIIKAKKMHYFSILFCKELYMFWADFTVHHKESCYCIHSNRCLSYWLC